jgi:hypothetical protein
MSFAVCRQTALIILTSSHERFDVITYFRVFAFLATNWWKRSTPGAMMVDGYPREESGVMVTQCGERTK